MRGTAFIQVKSPKANGVSRSTGGAVGGAGAAPGADGAGAPGAAGAAGLPAACAAGSAGLGLFIVVLVDRFVASNRLSVSLRPLEAGNPRLGQTHSASPNSVRALRQRQRQAVPSESLSHNNLVVSLWIKFCFAWWLSVLRKEHAFTDSCGASTRRGRRTDKIRDRPLGRT